MIYVCGDWDDYNYWVQFGNKGWVFDDFELLFCWIEYYEFKDNIYGYDGYVCIWLIYGVYLLFYKFVEVNIVVGVFYNFYYNGVDQEGVCLFFLINLG